MTVMQLTGIEVYRNQKTVMKLSNRWLKDLWEDILLKTSEIQKTGDVIVSKDKLMTVC